MRNESKENLYQQTNESVTNEKKENANEIMNEGTQVQNDVV